MHEVLFLPLQNVIFPLTVNLPLTIFYCQFFAFKSALEILFFFQLFSAVTMRIHALQKNCIALDCPVPKLFIYCLQFHAWPCRGCHLRELQSRWSVFGKWIWRHDSAILGRQHTNSSPCLPGTQKLGALHCLGAKFQKAGISLQKRGHSTVGS